MNTDKTTDCKVPWCNRQSQVNDERCAIHSEVHSAYRSASVASDKPLVESPHSSRDQSNETRADCRHCGRSIIRENGQWIDPQATGDDSIWREVCDSHDTFNAIHEPKPTLRTMYKVNTGPRRNRYFKTLQRAKVYCAQVFERSRVVLSIVETKH